MAKINPALPRSDPDHAALTILIQILAVIGFLFLSYHTLSYLRALASLFVLPGNSLRKYGRKGSWAVVTGASDGIGKEFVLQIARAGFNILLISRTESKLHDLAQEIENKHIDCKTKTIALDFTRTDEADYARVKATVDALDVAILVNNVGKSHDIPVPFILTSKQEMLDIITVNCIGTLRITQIIAPGMVQRKRGLILTMGSFAGLLPTPLLATYSGSKAFLQHWSTALGSELKPHGVDVELVVSYLVTSAMSKIRRPSASIPTPRAFVKSVLSKIGRSGGAQGYAHTSTPYWAHGLMQWSLLTFTGLYNAIVVDQNRAMHEGIRSRALKKAQRESKKAA